ncbi:hypothetical protein SEA_TOMAS_131 [Streptomyces phage Tomas]|uniref:Uncharacterized protein n=1 Tax=Streptomyces phage Tomas TaxID=2914443 RepID=A0AA49H0V9_9CAUD|nr:hypothetical protein PP453_gp159 [Streptomyces phage Tomas]UMO76308.1 hypothetical protein SEA_TOMAS_131 [Streptomyces phage Tomas]
MYEQRRKKRAKARKIKSRTGKNSDKHLPNDYCFCHTHHPGLCKLHALTSMLGWCSL